MVRRLPLSPEELADFCARHHIRKLSLYGSYSRGTNRRDSDMDLLVEFHPDREPGLIGLAGMELELSELLGGIHVELRTPQDLSRYFRDDVISEAEIQYAA